jgi:hypothetical protein
MNKIQVLNHDIIFGTDVPVTLQIFGRQFKLPARRNLKKGPDPDFTSGSDQTLTRSLA